VYGPWDAGVGNRPRAGAESFRLPSASGF